MPYKINIAGCQQISFTASGSTATSSVINSKSVVVYATKACFINIGTTAGSTGAANVYCPADTFLELDTTGSEQSTMTARGATESGVLYISPLVNK